jgi:hypothetical protein
MHIPNLIRQIPNQIENGFIQVIFIGIRITEKIVEYWTTKCAEWSQSDLWRQYGNPLYERNIKPLNRLDHVILGGSLSIAALVTAVAVKTLSIAALPLGLSLGALLFSGACVFSRSRARTHFDKIACEHIDQIRQIAYNITAKNQQFNTIHQYFALLQQPKFKHLENVIKELEEEIRKFKIVVLSPQRDDKQSLVKAHLAYVKTIVQGHIPDAALIDNLEKEVDKVGRDDQDLQALEMQKHKLHDLQTLQAHVHIVELQQQIDALVKAAEGPALADSKQDLMVYLERVQRNLDRSKTIEKLG